MKKIAVEKIEDGMILSRDVCNSSDNVLLSSGLVLSATLGRRLKNWGISFIYVEGEETIVEPLNTVATSPEKLKNHLLFKFSNVMQNPTMKKLFDAVYRYRLQKDNR